MEAKCCWVQTEAEGWSCTEFLQTLPVFSSAFPKTTPMRRCCECETLCKPLQHKGGKCFSSHVFGRHSFGFLKKQSKSKGIPGWVSRKVVTGGVLEGSETTPLLNKNLRGLLVILSSRWWALLVGAD